MEAKTVGAWSIGRHEKIPYIKSPYVKISNIKCPYVKISNIKCPYVKHSYQRSPNHVGYYQLYGANTKILP